METIVLNKKKKKIMWKRIFLMFLIIAATAVCIYCAEHFRIGYKYYAIDENGTKTILGTSANSKLIEKTLIEKLDKSRSNGYQVADHNMNHIVDKKWVITWNNNNDDANIIQSTIDSYIYVIVYALKLDINNKTYILPDTQGYDILHTLKKKDKNLKIDLLKGVYVDENEVLDQMAIDQLISNYNHK